MYRLLSLLLASVTSGVSAQGSLRPDPSQPSAAEPGLEYRSAFTEYRAFKEEKLTPWRDANEEVGRRRGSAEDARQGKPAPAKPNAGQEAATSPKRPPSAPAPGHADHQK